VLTRAQKEEQVAVMKDKIGRATGIILADYRGLTVPGANDLRQRLREKSDDYEYQVVKNSVLKLACAGTDAEGLSEHLAGPTSVAFSYGDPAGLAKVLVDYQEESEVFVVKGGYLDGKAIGTSEIATLATLPSLDQLRGQIVGLLQAPAGKIARILNEPGGQLARLVAARKDALGEG
jgi:large subunit ribosomal protein L10